MKAPGKWKLLRILVPGRVLVRREMKLLRISVNISRVWFTGKFIDTFLAQLGRQWASAAWAAKDPSAAVGGKGS